MIEGGGDTQRGGGDARLKTSGASKLPIRRTMFQMVLHFGATLDAWRTVCL